MLEEVWEKNARGDKQAALALADSALSMCVTDTTRCWLMCEKAVALLDMGKMDEAISAGRAAQEFAERIGDAEAVMNLCGTLGIAYRRQGRLDSAICEYNKGIEVALREQNTEYEIYLDNCISVLYSEYNRFSEAMYYASKAEEAAMLVNDTIERLSARANIGGIYLRQKQYRKAVEAMIPLWNNVLNAGYAPLTLKYLSVILKSYAVMGDDNAFGKYLPYADEAMKGMSLSSNGVLGILETKAYMLGRGGHYREQLALLDSLATTNHIMPDEKMKREMARCLAALGRKAEAYELMNQAYVMLDSVKQSGIERSMTEFSVRYKTLEKEKALEQTQREKAEAQRMILGLLAIVAVLIALVGILFYRRKVIAEREELQKERNFIKGQEKERERIARELHDGVCNDILAAKMLLAADSRLGEKHLHKIWVDVRHLSHALMPPRFGNVTLSDAVSSYVSMLSDDDKRNISLSIDEEFDWKNLQQPVAYETYRVIQEALGNAVRYGDEGSAIKVSLEYNAGKLVVIIANSVSKESAAGEQLSGIGSETMLRRAHTIGAELTTVSQNGTYVVRMTINLSDNI